jgi:hypothetical protein
LSYHALSPDDVSALEAAIDRAYEATPLPAQEYYKAAWTILSVSEDLFLGVTDVQTFLMLRDSLPPELASGEHLSTKLNHALNSTKFAIRQALNLLRTRLQPAKGAIDYVFHRDEEKVSALKTLFPNSEQYAEAHRQFVSYHKGFLRVIKHTDDSIEFAEPPETRPYAMLENLCWSEWSRLPDGDQNRTAIDVLIKVLNCHGDAKHVAESIKKASKAKNGKLQYTFITRLAVQVQSLLPERRWLIPDVWEFPWGTSAEILGVYRALCARSIYHLASVHYQAQGSRLLENGINQVCLTIPTKKLIGDLTRVSGVDPVKVEEIVSILTYGTGLTNPDPALQPIIPVGPDMVATPAHLITSSNYERNFLSLQIRLRPDSFDAASEIFEKMMTTELLNPLQVRFPIVRRNFRVPNGAQGEEVDIIVVDPEAGTIILFELAWMLSPGDVEEVINRIRVCRGKVVQLHRKVEAGRQFLRVLLERLGLRGQASWSINGIVVIDGFGGTPPDPAFKIPLVPQPVLITVLRHLKQASLLHTLLLSEDWLPREGRDFRTHSRSSEVLGCSMRQSFFELGPEKYFEGTIPRMAASTDMRPER